MDENLQRLERAEQALRANMDVYREWLYELCSQPSVSATGEGVAECCALVQRLCSEAGLEVEVISTPRNPTLFARAQGRSNTAVGFYNHYDVQPVDPVSEWETPPFEPTLKDGRLYVRGVADNKGNLVSRLAAVHAWLNANGDPPVGVQFVIDGDEEVGSPGLQAVANEVANRLTVTGLIWESGSLDADDQLVVYEGVKGVLTLELTLEYPRGDLHSMFATVVPNPGWRLIEALSGFDPFGEAFPGFLEDVEDPRSDDIAELAKYAGKEGSYLRALGADANCPDDALTLRHEFAPTFNLSGLQVGYTGDGVKTVLPHKAVAKIDIRLVPGQEADTVVEGLRSYLDLRGFSDIRIEVLGSVAPYRGDPSTQLISAVERAADGLYSGVIRRPTLAAAGPMHALCAARRIPAYAGPGTADHLSAIHAPNESIGMSNFDAAALGITRLLAHLAD